MPHGGNARLFYKVFGDFRQGLRVSAEEFRAAGVPQGCDVCRLDRKEHRDAFSFGLDGLFAQWLKAENPRLLKAAAAAPHALVLSGEVKDPRSLNYLRDAVGVVTAALEHGVAVFDPFIFKWWTPEEWHERVFRPASPVPRHHVVILVSDEEDRGLRWYHTRGMLKFGRPDLSVHGVSPDLAPGVEDLCNRFIELQAFGGVVREGQRIRMASLPSDWRCHHAGDLDDLDFNNRHLEIGPPRTARRRRGRSGR